MTTINVSATDYGSVSSGKSLMNKGKKFIKCVLPLFKVSIEQIIIKTFKKVFIFEVNGKQFQATWNKYSSMSSYPIKIGSNNGQLIAVFEIEVSLLSDNYADEFVKNGAKIII